MRQQIKTEHQINLDPEQQDAQKETEKHYTFKNNWKIVKLV